MKTKSRLSLLALALLAATGTPPLARAEDSKPCKEIHSACEAAGFTKGGHKTGKGLYVDCMKKIVAGESVAGVTVAPELVTACKAKKEKRSEKSADKPLKSGG